VEHSSNAILQLVVAGEVINAGSVRFSGRFGAPGRLVSGWSRTKLTVLAVMSISARFARVEFNMQHEKAPELLYYLQVALLKETKRLTVEKHKENQ